MDVAQPVSRTAFAVMTPVASLVRGSASQPRRAQHFVARNRRSRLLTAHPPSRLLSGETDGTEPIVDAGAPNENSCHRSRRHHGIRQRVLQQACPRALTRETRSHVGIQEEAVAGAGDGAPYDCPEAVSPLRKVTDHVPPSAPCGVGIRPPVLGGSSANDTRAVPSPATGSLNAPAQLPIGDAADVAGVGDEGVDPSEQLPDRSIDRTSVEKRRIATSRSTRGRSLFARSNDAASATAS